MQNNLLTSTTILSIIPSKGIVKQTQMNTVSAYLEDHIATASMVSKATGIPRSSIYAYKRRIDKSGRLFKVEKSSCQQTGYKAWYLTALSENVYLDFCLRYAE